MISMLEVLKASKGLPVSDLYAAMWGKQIAGKYTIAELEGALPLTFNANGEALIDYRIYGNTEQTGTPTPDNPIMPIGCGEMTENLFRSEDAKPVSQNYRYCQFSIETDLNTTYYIKNYTGNMTGIYIYGNPDYTSEQIAIGYNRDNLAFNSGAYSMAYIYIVVPENRDYRTDKIYIGKGSTTPTSYIPYGYKLPILSNSTVTNIYLGEVQTTRRIKKLVLTGEEAWFTFTTSYYIKVTNYYRGYDVGHHLSVCSHYPNAQMTTLPEMHYGLGGLIDGQSYTRWNGNIVFNPSPTISSLTDWKSYLTAQYAAGTPVTVWYVLAEPETGIVNEPLMKIGDHTDTVSMEQAGVSIPTNKGSTVIDYDGTPKPEKMYIKYLEVKK